MLSKFAVTPEKKQDERKRIFSELCKSVTPDKVIESGIECCEFRATPKSKDTTQCEPSKQLVLPILSFCNRKLPSSCSSLSRKYTDFKCVLDLICDETGHGYKGKDCTCGSCKTFFKENPSYIDTMKIGLQANWGETASRKDRRINLIQDLFLGFSHDKARNKFKQSWYIGERAVC